MEQKIYKAIQAMVKWSLLFYLFTFLPLSCEKEIDVDYHQVDQLYVAEGLVTQDGTTNRTNRPTYVRLTTTQDMTDNVSNGHNLAGEPSCFLKRAASLTPCAIGVTAIIFQTVRDLKVVNIRLISIWTVTISSRHPSCRQSLSSLVSVLYGRTC